MNNDASPSSRRSIPPQNELHSSATTGDSNETKTRQRLQQEKRAASLDHLILNLDIMIYLQFSCIYYME